MLLCLTLLSLVERRILHPRLTRYQSGNYYSVLDSYEEEKVFSRDDQNETVLKPFEITRKKSIYA